MMSDLIERLRHYDRRTAAGDMVEAAQRIEELEKVLHRIVNGGTAVLCTAVVGDCPVNPEVLEQIVKDAMAVLREQSKQ
jgi:hypothetical protein